MADRRKKQLKKLALRLEQNRKHPLYLLSLTAAELVSVADIFRLSRSSGGKLLGYQRGEMRRHIQDIVAYLDSDDILFPNSIIIAFGSQVTFKRFKDMEEIDDSAVAGTLTIPLHWDGQQKPGWIVDGQQRTAALIKSSRSGWPVPVNAFVADETELQRDQFLRVNNTKPLPRGLITELLPEILAPLPRKLAAKKLPSALCDLLHRDPASPFHGLIRRASTPAAERRRAVIADASVIRMLEESLTTPAGCLFPYHNISTNETDLSGLWGVLLAYWSAVRETFPGAWGRPPSESRLMHGTGICAMGRLMDRMLAGFDSREADLRLRLTRELQKVVPVCRWTSGRWEELELDWREVQNVPRHLRLLSSLLVRVYIRGAGRPAVKFFFPDSQDLVDPSFDFDIETRSETRVRQRDDQYPHEIFSSPPYDGMLVSKAIVEGTGAEAGSRYTLAQRHRLLREGVQSFFRLGDIPIKTMGDCGAFSYVREKVPPFTAQEVIDFYTQCGFQYGLSVDHVILGFQPEFDQALPGLDLVPEDWRERQRITFALAEEFLRLSRAQRVCFTPVGIAQGWSPVSYASAVRHLQKLGYRYIALGGMVPLKTAEILSCLKEVSVVRRTATRLHLLGVTRLDRIQEFCTHGVVSFDSTSPLRQAFKDDKDNYYTSERTYSAIRVPQVEGNAKLRSRIVAGEVNQDEARRLERRCLELLKEFDQEGCEVGAVIEALRAYEKVHDARSDRSAVYAEILEARPWKDCPCEICRRLGIHVMLFRGAERNRRRGFHNLFVFYRKLRRETCLTERAEEG